MDQQPSAHAIRDNLYAELITLVYRQNLRAFWSMLLTIGLITYLIQRSSNIALAFTWGGIALSVLFFRLIVLQTLSDKTQWNNSRKLQILCGLSLLHSVTHASALLFFGVMPAVDRTVLSMILVALSAGSIGTSAGYQPLFWCYSAPVILAASISWFVNFNAPVEHFFAIVIGLAMLALLLTLATLSHHTFRYFSSSVSAMQREKALTQQLTIALDKAQEEKKRAEASNQSKVRFLAAASHDLRQPVHVLTLFSAALQQQKLAPEVKQICSSMDEAIDSLAAQIHSLLDVSKLDAGLVEAELTSLSMSALLQTLVREHARDAETAGITLHVEITPDVRVDTDPVMLTQIVRNLLSNAIKYTDKGRIDILLTEDSGNAVLVIRDTGIGISESNIDKVCEEFFQVGNTQRDASQGLGLGLAIVQRLCKLLGAEVKLTSTLGQGTTVTVNYPLTADTTAITANDDTEVPVRAYGLSVHIVDDSELVRNSTRAILDELGCHNTVAASTSESLAVVRNEKPDVFLIDLRLGGGDSGIMAIDALGELFPHSTFAMVSGESELEHLGLEHRGIRTLKKPLKLINLVELLDEIQEQLPRHASTAGDGMLQMDIQQIRKLPH